MENKAVGHPWEEQEDDELEEGLIARRKNLNPTPRSANVNDDFSSNNGDSIGVTNGEHQHQPQQEQAQKLEDEVKDFNQQNDIKVDEGEQEKEKQHVSEYSVYYDKDKGNTDITINNQDNGNGMHSVNSNQNGEHQKHEISFEDDKSIPSYINNKTEITEIEVIKDGDDEITEFDVETVLMKQETHDLFCPNCHSCITKRVILRKRKRKISVSADDAKRNKPENPIPSVVLNDSIDNQSWNGIDHSLENVQPPTSNEYDNQQEPDVFRCLSCFSIFMPTGNGFKLFRIFGNKSNESSQKEVSVKKSWFSNFFGSDNKVVHNVTDLDDSDAVQTLDAETNVAGVSIVSSNLNSSMQEANSLTTNGTTDLDKNQLQSDNIIRESNGRIATDSSLADTQEQLLTSYHIDMESNSKSEYPGTFVVKPPLINNVDPAENAFSPLQHDGLKLLVPPNVGSLIIDNSQMNQELDITVQTNISGLDEKGRTNLSFSPPASILGELNLGSQMNGLGLPTNLAINGKEQKMEKDNNIMPEVSQQHTVQNNVDIHLEEPLKVDKDVLTDKQINLLEDLKNVERIKGEDTIITIGIKQPDASTFQRPQDTLGVTGTPALQQAVEQGGVTTATGGGRSLDIIKSIVYGGLIELIMSLSVVSSAAGAHAATLNVLALGLANIFGGLFVISHDLWDLKNERTRKTEDRYQQLLGQRADFPLHVVVSLLSYLIFGFLPPIVYGFSFRESNDKDFKLLMVAAASIVCIMILAAAKAYVQSPLKSYFKTIVYYVVFGFMVSGVSYLFGSLIMKLLEKIDIFHSGSVVNPSIHGASSKPDLATY